MVDRSTFGGNIIETGTDSYRLTAARARAEQAAVLATGWRSCGGGARCPRARPHPPAYRREMLSFSPTVR